MGAESRTQQFIETRAIRFVLRTSPDHRDALTTVDLNLEDLKILKTIQTQLPTSYRNLGVQDQRTRG